MATSEKKNKQNSKLKYKNNKMMFKTRCAFFLNFADINIAISSLRNSYGWQDVI